MKSITALFFIVLYSGMSMAISNSPLEQKLLTERTSVPTRESLGKLYVLRTNAPNAKIQQMVVKMCAAGLSYLGDTKTYMNVRTVIEQVDSFENSMCTPCEQCAKQVIGSQADPITPTPSNRRRATSGATFMSTESADDAVNQSEKRNKSTPGMTEAKCLECNGSGRCPNATCRNGTRIMHGFNGNSSEAVCPTCKGVAQCLKCKGNGVSLLPCRACNAKGNIFKKSAALEQYKFYSEQIIGVYEKDRIAIAENEQKQKYDAKMRETEITTKREAIIIEAQTAGAERAKQEVAFKEREIERKQQEEEDSKNAQRDVDFMRSCVIIQGDKSSGSGFVVIFKEKKVIMSNAHVLCGNKTLTFMTPTGKALKYKNIYICKKENILKDIDNPNFQKYRDIVMYELANEIDIPALAIHDIKVKGLSNQERVVVFGNSHGRNVATTLRGKIKGNGPEIIEIDTTFVPGNSGGPIIAYDYNAIVGMVTFMKNKPNIDWTNNRSGFDVVRYFGVRIDNVEWNDFELLDMEKYNKFLATFDNITEFASTELAKASRARSYYVPTAEATKKADSLLTSFRGVPEWISSYADDAKLAAYVCHLILQKK